MRLVSVLLAICAVALAAGDGNPAQAFGPVWATMDTGNCKVSVIAHGGVGYTNLPPSGGPGLGVGFRFPRTAASSRLFYCGMLVGNDSSYVADRFYAFKPTNANIDSDFVIVDTLHRDNWYGGQEYTSVMSDARHPTPKDLMVSQHALMLPGSYGNGGVFIYDYWTSGGTPIAGLYAALWADMDIGGGGAEDDAHTDATRRLAYIRATASENPCVGLAILDPHQASNLSTVFHQVWVYPDSCVSNYQKIRWLTGELTQAQSSASDDWSILTATGPFDVTPGTYHRVAFAMIAGTSQAELERKLDSLQQWYDGSVGIGSGEFGVARPTVLTLRPNPVSDRSRITFGAAVNTPIELNLYDGSGRLIRQLWRGSLNGRLMTTDFLARDAHGARLEKGIYFLRMESSGITRTLKTVVTR